MPTKADTVVAEKTRTRTTDASFILQSLWGELKCLQEQQHARIDETRMLLVVWIFVMGGATSLFLKF